MRAIRAAALLAVLGLAATGCGATKKIVVNVQTAPPPIAQPGITLDHRIGPVSFAEPKPQVTKSLGPGVAARLDGHQLRFYPEAGIYVAYPPTPPKGKPTVAAVVITRSARYKTRSGIGVGSTLRQLRDHIKVTCFGGKPVPGQCQHEKTSINLPFTVFNIGPTKRVVEVAIVPGGD